MILHCTGTTVPGAPLRPEFLKAHVYLPPAFVDHNPQLREPIMGLVQLFIETIALKTARDWPRRAQVSFGYRLTQPGYAQANQPMTSFPEPELNSSYYKFLGQPTTIPTAGAASPSSIPSSSYSYDSSNDFSVEADEILNLQEIIHTLQEENSSLTDEVATLRSSVTILESQLRIFAAAPGSPGDQTPSRRFQTTVRHTTPTSKNYRFVEFVELLNSCS